MKNKEEKLNKDWQERIKEEFSIHFKSTPEEFQWLLDDIEEIEKEAYKDGYNQCLKDRGLVGERWQHLYL